MIAPFSYLLKSRSSLDTSLTSRWQCIRLACEPTSVLALMLAHLFAPPHEFHCTTCTIILTVDADLDAGGQATTDAATITGDEPCPPTMVSLQWEAIRHLPSFLENLTMTVLTAS